MKLSEKIAMQKIAELTDSEVSKLKQIASSRSITQHEFSDRAGISVNTLRKELKDLGIKWRPQVRKVLKKPVKPKPPTEFAKNIMYKNPNNSKVRAPHGSGYVPIREV